MNIHDVTRRDPFLKEMVKKAIGVITFKAEECDDSNICHSEEHRIGGDKVVSISTVENGVITTHVCAPNGWYYSKNYLVKMVANNDLMVGELKTRIPLTIELIKAGDLL